MDRKFFIIKKRYLIEILYVICIILCYNSYNRMFYYYCICINTKLYLFEENKISKNNTLAYCIVYINILIMYI